MADIGVLVKVSAETHVQLKKACGKHQRSIQKVMLALLEGWLENGSPDPLEYGSGGGGSAQPDFADQAARESIVQLATDLEYVKKQLKALEAGKGTASKGKNFEAFYEALRAASETDSDQKVSKELNA